MTFVQTIAFRSLHEQKVQDMLDKWQKEHSDNAVGLRRSWLMRDKDKENTYLMSVEFDSHDAAMKNSERPETSQWADELKKFVEGELSYRNYDIIWGKE